MENTNVTTAAAPQTGLVANPQENLLQKFCNDVLGSSIDNFDGNEQHKLRLRMMCDGMADYDADTLPGGKMRVKYLYAAETEVLQDDGELSPAIRVVLVSEDYKTCKFCSEGVAKSVATIMLAVSKGGVKFPMNLKVIRGKTRKGRTIFNLAIAD